MDTMGAQPVYNVGGGNDDFMGGSGMWVFFLFFLLAWGGNGIGGFGNNAASTVQGQITNDFLFNNLNNQLGRMQDQNVGLSNAIQQGLCNLGYENLSNFKDLTAQMSSCCCETNRNIDAVRYENAKNTCDIIQASNANTDRILGYLTQNEIQSLRDQLQSANLTLSNATQTTNIINAVRPFPSPAYVTCSPYTSPLNGCGCV